MTAPSRTITPRVRKAAHLLQLAIYGQLVVASAALLTGFDVLYLLAVILLLGTTYGLYRCRQWRSKWEEQCALDEREQALYLRARSNALGQLSRGLGPLFLLVAVVALLEAGMGLASGFDGDVRLVTLDVSDLVILIWGFQIAIDSLPTLLLIAEEAPEPADKDALDGLATA